MKKRPIIIIAAVAALSVSVLLLSRNTVAYLMDTEAADNVVQIGQVEVSLDEGGYTNNSVVEIGRIIDKAPKLKNTGKNDEYVFLKVSVPKENVTLLYETSGANYKEGAKIPPGTPQDVEIFKLIATGTNKTNLTFDPDDPTRVIGYNAVATSPSTDGWVYLRSVTSDTSKNTYIFGYNRKLKVNNETVTLFDKVQLKSFIDGEVAGNTTNEKDKSETVNVTAYAIQADDLNLDGVNTADNAYLNATALGKIWTIVNNKNIGNG